MYQSLFFWINECHLTGYRSERYLTKKALTKRPLPEFLTSTTCEIQRFGSCFQDIFKSGNAVDHGKLFTLVWPRNRVGAKRAVWGLVLSCLKNTWSVILNEWYHCNIDITLGVKITFDDDLISFPIPRYVNTATSKYAPLPNTTIDKYFVTTAINIYSENCMAESESRFIRKQNIIQLIVSEMQTTSYS